ncbi:MAG: hypothetical protein M3373_11335 [Gemmatimonadota bacterium]|nr:hypothetical protein [Gemmatimonadota bacterium]
MSTNMGADSPFAAPSPLACVPGAIPAAQRPAHFELLARLFGEHSRERWDIPDGYAFRFEADAFDDVARFVTNERRCCPFLTFTIELSADGGPLWFRLSGPTGTRDFLDAELASQRPGGAPRLRKPATRK